MRLLLPVIIVFYLLAGLFVFVLLQGDLHDWHSFMLTDNSMVLFGIYAVTGLLGLGLTFLLKKDLDVLSSPRKIVIVALLVAVITGACVFTYLNFSSTEEQYVWMHDGALYTQMGHSLIENHEFMENGVPTHHAGPIFPIYLSTFYTILPTHLGTQIAEEIIFVLAAFAIFYITRKMYGAVPALLTTALVTTVPIYVFATSRGFGEPLVLILYTLTLFCILESLNPEKEHYIIFAGFLAGLGFLSKSGFGYFFIVTGASGFLWRFYYLRWRLFKNKNYVIAVAVFLSLLGVWTARNLYQFWDGTFWNLFEAGQSSKYINEVTLYALNNLGYYFVETLFFSVFTVIIASGYVWIFAGHLRKAWHRIREEKISLLFVSAAITLIVSVLATSMEFCYENNPLVGDNYFNYLPVFQVRYLIYVLFRYYFVALVPLSWLAYEAAKKDKLAIPA